jgi:undecaprenyl-diphosphatase
MDLIWAVVYGIIQGLTEFLPISSSGHLALLPKFFEVKDPGVIFDLVMHVGTAFAVIIYFRKDIFALCLEGWYLVRKDPRGHHSPFALNFIVATIASVIMILLLKDFALANARTSTWIAANLIIFGILMWIADLKKDTGVDLVKERNIKRAIIIGVAQSMAIFPGVSRSGVTITAARFLKMERQDASRFSFLMSLPIILASVAYKLPAIFKGEAISESVAVIVTGVLVSFVVGLLTIHFFLKLIAKTGLVYYTVYRVILGIAILLLV